LTGHEDDRQFLANLANLPGQHQAGFLSLTRRPIFRRFHHHIQQGACDIGLVVPNVLQRPTDFVNPHHLMALFF